MKDVNGVRTAQDLERKYDFSSIGRLKKNYEVQKETLTKIENELSDFVVTTTRNIEELQDQVDGNITTWFSSGIPTISNYPASDWTTIDEKNNHLGDLYYDQNTGYAYRFIMENNIYSWLKIEDSDVAEALAIANAAKDTADSKRRIFITQPIPPYDVGDLWINNEELYRCQTTKSESEIYEFNDWIKATKYTDDTVANQVGNNLTILSGTVTEIREDVDDLTTTMTNTTSLVDEQGRTIGNLQTKTSQMEQTVDNITSTINHELIISRIKNSTGSLTLENAHKGFLHKLSIKGQISLLFPQSENNLYGYPLVPNNNLAPSNTLTPSSLVPYSNEVLYPSSNLYLRSNVLLIDNKEYELDIDFLNYINNEVCDEFIYEDGKCQIIRRVGIDSQGNKYALDNEVSECRKDIMLEVDKTSVIRLKSFDNCYYEVTYLLDNTYTNSFATKVELNSSITQTADEINLEVSKKVDSDKIISRINQSAEQIQIEAEKINLKGKKFNLTTDDIEIESTNFTVDKDGNMKCVNGEFNGKILGGSIHLQKTADYEGTSVLEIDTVLYDETISGKSYFNGDYWRMLSNTGTGQINATVWDNSAFLSVSGNITCQSVTQTSLEEKKKNIEKLTNAKEILNSVDIYKYNFKDEKDGTKKSIGFIIGSKYNYSQEITSTYNDGANVYSMVSVLWQVVKEQQGLIENLQKRIEILESKESDK